MPISKTFAEPKSANSLTLAEDTKTPFFIAFLSSLDPVTKQAWCPDVRAALPVIEKKFEGVEDPEVALVWVGQRPEYDLFSLILPLNSQKWMEEIRYDGENEMR